MNEISPGPWRWVHDAIVTDDGTGTAALYECRHDIVIPNPADGQAIIAVPELVAALKAVPRMISGKEGQYYHDWRVICEYPDCDGHPVILSRSETVEQAYDRISHSETCPWRLAREALRRAGVE